MEVPRASEAERSACQDERGAVRAGTGGYVSGASPRFAQGRSLRERALRSIDVRPKEPVGYGGCGADG
ncbi:hypothetical protein GCM10011579_073920 [Streptomyces albiflavescens]|uniref:Uncharacterized protein n=1 Tax=Streptomyces albiflavescens TaxID=1623582 RepID=A0A918D853_9ACTN|nr:hypothetical protein GCM10011579_073920 [Streptomyces albiflavescens]